MTPLLTVVVALFTVGILVGAYAAFAPNAPLATGTAPEPARQTAPVPETVRSPMPTADRFGEFAALSESARCDLIFSMDAIDDEGSRSLLLRALDDQSEAVALAAARAFARAGSIGDLHRYAAARPGPRARALLQTLAILQ